MSLQYPHNIIDIDAERMMNDAQLLSISVTPPDHTEKKKTRSQSNYRKNDKPS
jgi:hypothetical protein